MHKHIAITFPVVTFLLNLIFFLFVAFAVRIASTCFCCLLCVFRMRLLPNCDAVTEAANMNAPAWCRYLICSRHDFACCRWNGTAVMKALQQLFELYRFCTLHQIHGKIFGWKILAVITGVYFECFFLSVVSSGWTFFRFWSRSFWFLFFFTLIHSEPHHGRCTRGWLQSIINVHTNLLFMWIVLTIASRLAARVIWREQSCLPAWECCTVKSCDRRTMISAHLGDIQNVPHDEFITAN